jgi:hypothetical protein
VLSIPNYLIPIRSQNHEDANAYENSVLQSLRLLGLFACGSTVINEDVIKRPKISCAVQSLAVRAIQCFGQRSDSQIAFQPTGGFGIA